MTVRMLFPLSHVGMESKKNDPFEIFLYPGSKCCIASKVFLKVIIEQIYISESDGNENEER